MEHFKKVNMTWCTGKNWKREAVDYNTYFFSRKEVIRYGGQLVLGLSVLSYVFYDTFIPVILLVIPAGIVFFREKKEACIAARKHKLKQQFLSGIQLLGDYLRSGYAVENALQRSIGELTELWGEESDIVHEWKYMVSQMRLSCAIEQVWKDFGRRSHVEEIETFSEIFSIIKRSGGQLSEIVSRSSNQLSRTFFAEEQIQNSIASKRYEQKIMNVMPVAILAYIKFSSPEFIAVLYEGLLGRSFMSVCLVIYGLAYLWSKKIINIKI